MKQLQHVKQSSKAGFSHQEISNSSQDTDIKQLKNVIQWSKPAFYHSRASIQQLKNMNSSFKSPFSPQELPNLSEDTNIKRLKNVKLSSKSVLRLWEHPKSHQNHYIKAATWHSFHRGIVSPGTDRSRILLQAPWPLVKSQKKLRHQEKGHPR